jgi:hypothetical protein
MQACSARGSSRARSGSTPQAYPCPETARPDTRGGPWDGVDLDEDGNGVLEDGRLYQLVRQHDAVGERTLQITFLEPGARAYAFTSG